MDNLAGKASKSVNLTDVITANKENLDKYIKEQGDYKSGNQ
jgi:hypothetical protein